MVTEQKSVRGDFSPPVLLFSRLPHPTLFWALKRLASLRSVLAQECPYYIFSSFLAVPGPKFLGQGLNLSCSWDLFCSCSGILNPLCRGCGLNLCLSSDPNWCRVARYLTCGTTVGTPIDPILNHLLWANRDHPGSRTHAKLPWTGGQNVLLLMSQVRQPLVFFMYKAHSCLPAVGWQRLVSLTFVGVKLKPLTLTTISTSFIHSTSVMKSPRYARDFSKYGNTVVISLPTCNLQPSFWDRH